MTKQFPPSFAEIWRQPNVRATFIGDLAPTSSRDCANCGGLGFISMFVAYAGPFQHVPSGRQVLHYGDNAWWVGETFMDACPVCGNGGDRNAA